MSRKHVPRCDSDRLQCFCTRRGGGVAVHVDVGGLDVSMNWVRRPWRAKEGRPERRVLLEQLLQPGLRASPSLLQNSQLQMSHRGGGGHKWGCHFCKRCPTESKETSKHRGCLMQASASSWGAIATLVLNQKSRNTRWKAIRRASFGIILAGFKIFEIRISPWCIVHIPKSMRQDVLLVIATKGTRRRLPQLTSITTFLKWLDNLQPLRASQLCLIRQ